jgi:hypothetical protein
MVGGAGERHELAMGGVAAHPRQPLVSETAKCAGTGLFWKGWQYGVLWCYAT